MAKNSKISNIDAINRFVSRNKQKVINTFGSEERAKAILMNDIEVNADFSLWSFNWSSYSKASKAFNMRMHFENDPAGYNLHRAKISASYTSDKRKLNGFRSNQFVDLPNSLNIGSDGHVFDREVIGYYYTKTGNLVLAHIYGHNGNDSPFDYWQVLNKAVVGL